MTATELFHDLVTTSYDTPKSERTAAQVAADLLGDLDGQVRNGGFSQYLYNICRDGDRLPLQAIDLFLQDRTETVAIELRGIIKRVLAIPQEHLDYQDDIDLLERVNDKLHVLDDLYYGLEASCLHELYCRLLGADPAAVVAALEAEAAEMGTPEQPEHF